MNKQTEKVLISEDKFIRSQLDESGSAWKKYACLVTGESKLSGLVKYELITTLFGWIPGALGLMLRKIFYPLLFRRIGNGVVFGRDITLRNTSKMVIGNNVVIDDYAVLDARGSDDGEFIIDDEVIVGRGAVIQSKAGPLGVGARSSVGSFCTIVSQGGISIANDVAIGGGSKISGGLFKISEEGDKKLFERYSNGPILIEEHCILSMGCIVIDNVQLGSGTMVGSGVTVSTHVPAHSIVATRPPLIMKQKETNRTEGG